MRKETSFNRNIVECKCQCRKQLTNGIDRFNRNIVECKCGKNRNHPGEHLGFNRNIVECKSVRAIVIVIIIKF